MNDKNISRDQIGQDDRMDRMRRFLGGHLVRTRNPVDLVHPVRKVLSREPVASSGLDGVSAHRGSGLTSIRGFMLAFVEVRNRLMQLVDFQDSFG